MDPKKKRAGTPPTRTIGVRLPVAQIAKLDKKAQEVGITRNELIVALLAADSMPSLPLEFLQRVCQAFSEAERLQDDFRDMVGEVMALVAEHDESPEAVRLLLKMVMRCDEAEARFLELEKEATGQLEAMRDSLAAHSASD